MTNTKEKRFEETWRKLLSMVMKDPKLKASDFYKSVSVDKTEFIAWMSSHDYGNTFPEVRGYIIKQLKGQPSVIVNLQEVEKQTLISNQDSSITNNTKENPTETPQYWWLNVNAKIWELDKANKNETKKINCDVQFNEWISNYLNDRRHLGIPIAQRELAISLLDYCGITINDKMKKTAMIRIEKNLYDFIQTSDYVVNPLVVLKTKTDKVHKFRRTAAWMYPSNPDGSIQLDSDGNRLPRELDKKKQYRTYYFYRKGTVPREKYDKSGAHDGDPDYVQAAPDVDSETNDYPNISDIRPIISVSSMKKGDSVIACMNNKIVAFIDVVSCNGEEVNLKITKKLPTPFLISSLNKSGCNYIPEKNLGFFHIAKTDFYCISDIIDIFMRYSREDLLNEAFIDEKTYDDIVRALDYKKNIILQGVPGVGKTFLAKKLAYTMVGHIDEERVCVVQFHPNYTYEDFIIGYKPCDDGKFQLKPGVFMEFCKKAAEEKKADDKNENKYFFIIDEINRGNLSKIFGEAFTLIDKDHRGESIKLANSDDEYKEFEIPENVYIIGLMNTADRSLAMLDIALQRRFEFLPLMPAFETKSFKKYMDSLKSDIFKEVINRIIKLNKEIEKEPALGEGFCIGHSYFCISKERNEIEYKKCLKDIKSWLKNVIHYEIIPILRAYCFDEKEMFDRLSTPLLEVFK